MIGDIMGEVIGEPLSVAGLAVGLAGVGLADGCFLLVAIFSQIFEDKIEL